MSETPVPQDPGRDEDPPGTPAGPGDHPSLGAPGWRLVPCSPDWDEAYLAAIAEDEYPKRLGEGTAQGGAGRRHGRAARPRI